MNKVILLPLLILTSCQFLTSPEKEELLQYESKTLSPCPPPGYPPMAIPGSRGP